MKKTTLKSNSHKLSLKTDGILSSSKPAYYTHRQVITIIIAINNSSRNLEHLERIVNTICKESQKRIFQVGTAQDVLSSTFYYHPKILFLDDSLNIDNESGQDITRVIFGYLPNPPMIVEFGKTDQEQDLTFYTSALDYHYCSCKTDKELAGRLEDFVQNSDC